MMTLAEYLKQYRNDPAGRERVSHSLPGLYARAAGKATVTNEGATFRDAKGYELAFVWPDDRVVWCPGGQDVVRKIVGL